MFFDKYDIDDDSVTLEKLIERISQSIEENISYTPDYQYGKRVRLEEAEEILLELHNVVKRLK